MYLNGVFKIKQKLKVFLGILCNNLNEKKDKNVMSLIVGNVFSLLSAICIAVSAAKRNKKGFMLWQIGDTLFGVFANLALMAYAALIISIACLVRNILSYKEKLTMKITLFLVMLSIVIGVYINNLGIIGWLPIVASASFTICIYVTKNEQQMRYALVLNQLLWLAHNLYVQAYPSAVACIGISVWTVAQIIKNKEWQCKKN